MGGRGGSEGPTGWTLGKATRVLALAGPIKIRACLRPHGMFLGCFDDHGIHGPIVDVA